MPDATTKPLTAVSASGNCPSGDPENPFRYTAALAETIEERWQAWWEENETFRTPNPGEPGFDPAKPKFFCLDMFPYPSGAGLHVGHPEGYTATDIVSRFKRLKGHQVLHPMGWDAFGLPAEQYAIQTGVHPAVTTRKAIDTFRRQLKRFGFSYDWSREFATIDEDYYKWTQWIWLRAYNAWFDPSANRARPIRELIRALEDGDARIGPSGELVWSAMAGDTAAITGQPVGCRAWHELSPEERRAFVDNRRLAYLGQQTVNWCPELGTVLANEEVIDGRSERGGYPVHRIPLKQWMFRITDYAERLLEDLTTLDWPESTRTMQREWIGRSEGAEVDFPYEFQADQAVVDGQGAIRIFTTRPDTIFGATYMVLAPEHPLVDGILSLSAQGAALDGLNRAELEEYVKQARNRADVDRLADTKEKTGVFTGIHAINPATGMRIPVWVADYVLMGYGHGAIMAVPAHDERDFEFAQKFGLPIRDVVHNRMLTAIAEGAQQHANRDSEDWATRFVEFIAISIGENVTDPARVWRLVDDRLRQKAVEPAPKPRKKEDFKALLKTPLSEIGPDPEQYRMIATIWYEALLDASGGDLSQLARAAEEGRLVEMLGRPVSEAGVAVNSANEEVSLNGLTTSEAKKRIIDWLGRTGRGRRKVNFKLRDWLFSRQRYWGEPFPIVYDEAGNHYPVSEDHLPVRLPEMDDYRPIQSDTPQPPLAKATNWVKTTAGEAGVSPDLLPPDTPVMRETNTMPGWAGSCWYYLRYCDPHNNERFISREAERYWMTSLKRSAQEKGVSKDAKYDAATHHIGGVDLYIGGAEHAVLHLLYARFWHKILFDLGEVSTPEPMGRLFHQGMICSYAYQRADKSLVPTDEVEQVGEEKYIETKTGEPVTQIVAKMSKSLKNVVNPDDIIREFGADTFRLYEMYMGPLEATKPWNTRDMVGPFRFLQRLWRLAVNERTGELNLVESPDADIEKQLHRAIAKVEQDIDRLAFNTAIAAMIEFVNVATSVAAAQTASGAGGKSLTRDQLERFTIVLAPFAPHMAEELWRRLGHDETITYAEWPTYDPALLMDNEIELAVQVMGKVRSRITVPVDADNEAVEQAALADEKIQAIINGKTVRKVIVVPGKLVNIVAN